MQFCGDEQRFIFDDHLKIPRLAVLIKKTKEKYGFRFNASGETR